MNAEQLPVFVGPSLPQALRPAGRFDWRPPAVAGDLIALAEAPPGRLCLIDGLFDSQPAPWHKELLTLMSRGTIVFGAASMGALRAAELDRFGMIGVGAAYRAYRDGRLTGDDEVALIHATIELDWVPLSVPMIEVRATLIAAVRARLIDPGRARAIRALVREIHFCDRDWPAMARACRSEGLAELDLIDQLAALHVPLKQRDALDCLNVAVRWNKPVPRPDPPPATVFLAALAARRS